MKHLLKRCLSRWGYECKKTSSLAWEEAFYRRALRLAGERAGEPYISVVFSRDRAMQLHAFLRSYRTCVLHPGRMWVLYKASDAAHETAYRAMYESLEGEWGDDLTMLLETDFRAQFNALLADSRARRVYLYVDDMMFLHPFDLIELDEDPDALPSLCRGGDMDYSPVLEKDLVLPRLRPWKGQWLRFRWNERPELSDWSYPLGVSGYGFDRCELLAMCRELAFRNPNTLEAALQAYRPVFLRREGLCAKEAVCCCVHANRVQTDIANPSLDFFSVEELLSRWQEGWQIDLKPFLDSSRRTACRQTYTFVRR